MLEILVVLCAGMAGFTFLCGDEGLSDESDDLTDDEESAALDTTSESNQGNSGNGTDTQDGLVQIDDILFDADFLADRAIQFGDTDANNLDGASGDQAQIPEHLFGGDGDDQLKLGTDDVGVGGRGEDTFIVAEGAPATILDYELGEKIFVEYSGSAPQLTSYVHDTGTSIFADGVKVINLENSFNIDLSDFESVQKGFHG